MLCGEVLRRERDIRALLAERSEMRRRIQALDATMAMFAPRLDPAAGGTVRAITGKYETYGGLSAFLKAQLQAAGHAGVDTRALLERAVVRFCVDLNPPGARKRFKDTLLWMLRDLERKRFAEVAVDSMGGHKPKVWRVVQETRFQDLLAQQEAIDDQAQNAV